MRYNKLLLLSITFGIIILVSGCVDSNTQATQPYSQPILQSETSELPLIDQSETLWTYDGPITQLTSNDGRQTSPVWSPDGQMLVFEQDGEIFILDMNDREPYQLASGYNPTFSPDGSEVFFLRPGEPIVKSTASNFSDSVTGLEAIAISLDGSNERELAVLNDIEIAARVWITPPPKYGVWSPSGNHVTIQIRGKTTRLAIWDIEKNQLNTIETLQPLWYPVWSPDGSKMVVSGMLDSEIDKGKCDLWVIDADTGELYRLTDTDTIHEDCPAWSPDGTQIAFVSFHTNPSFMFSGSIDSIYIINPDGTDQKLIVERFQPWGAQLFNDEQLCWSPDGASLTFPAWVVKADSETSVNLSLEYWAFDIKPDSTNNGVSMHYLLSKPCCNEWVGKLRWSPDGSRIAFEMATDALYLEDEIFGVFFHQNLEGFKQHIYMLELSSE